MVLRGTTVELNSGLTAPRIGRPLCPARHRQRSDGFMPPRCPSQTSRIELEISQVDGVGTDSSFPHRAGATRATRGCRQGADLQPQPQRGRARLLVAQDYPWTHFICGHLGPLATRENVVIPAITAPRNDRPRLLGVVVLAIGIRLCGAGSRLSAAPIVSSAAVGRPAVLPGSYRGDNPVLQDRRRVLGWQFG
jgi:hypothetical protein